MTTFSSLSFPRYVLILMAGALLLLLQGCAEKISIQNEDISGRVWLKTSSDDTVLDGFFTAPDGQLQLINHTYMEGLYWEIHDDHLLLWVRTEGQPMLQAFDYHPFQLKEKLVLSPAPEQGSSVYRAEELQEPLYNVYYLPGDFRKFPSNRQGKAAETIYIQLDSADMSLHGYGGVNNFYSHYQREGETGFKIDSISSTMMSGPGMDYELKLMQCLDMADSLISVRKQLFLYHGTRFLCSFSAQ